MRRCYQFSLRSLLALMLAVAAYCGGWTAARKNVDRELEEARRAATDAAQASQAPVPFNVDPIVWGPGNRSYSGPVELP